MEKKKPKVMRTIKSVEYYEKKLGKSNNRKKEDPIAHAHRMSKDSPNKMFKNSMAHLDRLLKKSK